ncbi:alpha/beta hydrolase [Flavobacterium sp. NG2]|uniref:alpha/beta fold hydrolase n=1 Tax=Flavobacterium sp. NG2 TaxID=3097547 RepID=UPI002A81522F|nr:alpha/beta hydrolase [Flavobacterium sp. NG2]WPR73240.1 alpha/beta hydrolase [Flavobacterium sp. NG2]
MINYIIYENKTSDEWVTFVHGAGGSSSIWFKQIRDFKKDYNLLLLDLRGHGDSKKGNEYATEKQYTFSAIANDILEVLDFLKIEKSHFVGISLGTILIRQLAEMHPQRVQCMILGGAILKLNLRSQILMKLGNMFKYVLPYLILYRFFAFVIMPKKNHKQARLIFINEAKKLYQKEFIKWFKLTATINPLLRRFRQEELDIPALYVMGEEDYMFLPYVIQQVKLHARTANLVVIAHSGHVVNVEKSTMFNEVVLSFLSHKKNADIQRTSASIN